MSTIRQLVLLRHAHALPATAGQDDHARNLSDVGQAEARAAAEFIAGLPTLTRALCSTAQRTRETAAAVSARLPALELQLESRIYEATPGQLLSLLEEQTDTESLLLIGHNPGLEQLVALLATGRSGDYRGMSPAAVAVLKLPSGSALEPGVAELAAFWSP